MAGGNPGDYPPRDPQRLPYGRQPQPDQPMQGRYGQPQYGQQPYPPQQYAQPQYQPYGHAYAPQGAPPTPLGYLPTDAFGGFWIRFVGYIIDVLVLAVPSTVVSVVIFAAMGFGPEIVFDFEDRQGLAMDSRYQLANNISNLANLLIFWPYYALMHSRYGATLGKLALGLRVVDDTGRYPSFGRATGRYFATILSGCLCAIGYIWAGFHGQKRALHDLIAGTYVVKKQFAPQAQQPGI
jgi:uncharacterized RDD family membrane protein YckC